VTGGANTPADLADTAWSETREGGPVRTDAGPEISSHIGRYVVLRKLGEGAMGLVFAGYDERLDRKVAIKVVSRLSSASEARVLREAQALARLSDPHVVAIYEADEWDGGIYIAMEFVAGDTLTAWQNAADPPPPAQVLALYMQAAQGLHAAHIAGIVHRDFKPDNALVGDDGRVRVLDFGLARAADESTPPQADQMLAASGEVVDNSGVLSADLTQTGAVLGTPAYMAPEQHRGRPADARSDQFSLCVALFEALYGTRPFGGATRAALALNVVGGDVIAPPPRPDVPRHVHAVLLRGLAPAPDDRFPDMVALIDALRGSAPVSRRWMVLSVAGMGVGLAAAATFMQPDAEAGPCSNAATTIEATWNTTRQTAIEDAFAATGLGYAPATATRLVAGLDVYTAAWSAQSEDACAATHIRQTQSAQLLDARMACLEGSRRQLETLLGAYASPDDGTVRAAVASLNRLPDLGRCSDGEALLDAVPPPTDPDSVEKVAAARGLLAQARGLTDAGRFDRATATLQSVTDGLEGVSYPAVWAELWWESARRSRASGQHDAAREDSERAYYAALRARHDELAARAAASVIDVSLEYLSDREHAEQWRPHARAFFDRLGARGPVPSDMVLSEVLVFEGPGSTDSDTRWAQAIARLESEPGSRLLLATVLNKRGGKVLGTGDSARAATLWKRAVDINEEVLGPDHPSTAVGRVNLALAAGLHGDHEGGVEQLTRARASMRQSLPADHPHFATIAHNLASDLLALGRVDEALLREQEALAAYEAAYGHDSMRVAGALGGLGAIAIAQDQVPQAIAYFDEAQRLWAEHGTYRDGRVGLLVGLGDAYQAARRWPEARQAYLDADALRVDEDGEADWRRFDALRGLAEVALHDGAQDAVASAQRALALAREGSPAAGDLARTLSVLAQAHHAAGDAKHAMQFATEALASFADAPAAHDQAQTRFAQQVASW